MSAASPEVRRFLLPDVFVRPRDNQLGIACPWRNDALCDHSGGSRKDGLKLADPARKDWPAIESRNVATLSWQPSRNPMEFVTIKWRERMAGKEPRPSHSSMEEIDVAITFTVPGGRRIVHHERIMALVDHRNHTMQRWS
jgi:hypothetical protein